MTTPQLSEENFKEKEKLDWPTVGRNLTSTSSKFQTENNIWSQVPE
jgi:hypothetical protein